MKFIFIIRFSYWLIVLVTTCACMSVPGRPPIQKENGKSYVHVYSGPLSLNEQIIYAFIPENSHTMFMVEDPNRSAADLGLVALGVPVSNLGPEKAHSIFGPIEAKYNTFTDHVQASLAANLASSNLSEKWELSSEQLHKAADNWVVTPYVVMYLGADQRVAFITSLKVELFDGAGVRKWFNRYVFHHKNVYPINDVRDVNDVKTMNDIKNAFDELASLFARDITGKIQPIGSYTAEILVWNQLESYKGEVIEEGADRIILSKAVSLIADGGIFYGLNIIPRSHVKSLELK